MKKRLQEKANGSALKRRRRLIVRNFAAGRCSRQLFALPAHRAVWQKNPSAIFRLREPKRRPLPADDD